MALRLTITRDMLRKCLDADALGITTTDHLERAARNTWDKLTEQARLAPPTKEWEVDPKRLDGSGLVTVKGDMIRTDDHGNLLVLDASESIVAIFNSPFSVQLKKPAAE